jgi:hypothetical protein
VRQKLTVYIQQHEYTQVKMFYITINIYSGKHSTANCGENHPTQVNTQIARSPESNPFPPTQPTRACCHPADKQKKQLRYERHASGCR